MPPKNEIAWHALAAEEALAGLGSNAEGLTDEEAAARLLRYGTNELPAERRPSKLLLFLKQFKGGLNYALFAAAAVSLLNRHFFDAVAIMLEIVINGVVGYVQERRAERALAKLKEMLVPTAAVRRAGRVRRVPASELVPGDVVIIAQGDRLTADVRLLDARELHADESSLTGESLPVQKQVAAVPEDAALGDRASVAYMGTLVTVGEGAGVVTSTGLRTVFGGIAGSLSAIKRGPTPLERRIDRLGRWLGLAALAAAAVIFAFGLFGGLPLLDMFLFAVASAVSIVPEGLPVVLAVTLAIGVQRMARRNAITRHLPAVETLGMVDVICTDKTGTLTENKMTVRRVAMLSHDIEVTGEGWKPEGEFLLSGERLRLGEHPTFAHLLRVAALCNRASLEQRDGRWTASGDPTEAALSAVGAKGGFDRAEMLGTERTLDEMPFTSERKYRAILHAYAGPDGEPIREIMVVGAFERLIGASTRAVAFGKETPLAPEIAGHFEDALARMAGEAMRTLGVAVKRVELDKDEVTHEDIRELTFLGIIGMTDPPRKGVAAAVAACQAAGIRVIMNTGDHRATALAVAREVGILAAGDDGRGRVYEDAAVAAMSDGELREALETAAVFARVSPQTKLRVVGALKALGHTVAMTGDGINDAPALKSSDIGVAMGLTATDVTKEVADMVLSDDNFISIVSAVEEGRIIFRNVRQTTSYLVMTNAGEAVTILTSLFLRLPLPLLPAQLLWLNVVTDGFTDVALATEKRHGDELSRPPRRKDASILSRGLLLLTALTSTLMAAGTLALFLWADADLAYARSMAFLSMSFFQLWNVFNMRSARQSIFSLGWTTNRWLLGGVLASVGLIAVIMYVPFFQPVFRLVALGPLEWGVALAVSSSVLWLVESYKAVKRRRSA